MSNQEMVDQIWTMFDKDGSGTLEADEAKKFLNKLVSASPELKGYED